MPPVLTPRILPRLCGYLLEVHVNFWDVVPTTHLLLHGASLQDCHSFCTHVTHNHGNCCGQTCFQPSALGYFTSTILTTIFINIWLINISESEYPSFASTYSNHTLFSCSITTIFWEGSPPRVNSLILLSGHQPSHFFSLSLILFNTDVICKQR